MILHLHQFTSSSSHTQTQNPNKSSTATQTASQNVPSPTYSQFNDKSATFVAPVGQNTPVIHQTYPAYNAALYKKEPHPFNYEYVNHDVSSSANFDAEERVHGTSNDEEYYAGVQSEDFAHHAPVIQTVPAYASEDAYNKPVTCVDPASDDKTYLFSDSYQQPIQPHLVKLVKTPYFPSKNLTFNQFWDKVTQNMKILQVTTPFIPFYIKRHLKGEAIKLVHDLMSVKDIEKILRIRYHDDRHFMLEIEEAHKRIGSIPELSNFNGILKTAPKHLALIRNAGHGKGQLTKQEYAITLRNILPRNLQWEMMSLSEDQLNISTIKDLIQSLLEFALEQKCRNKPQQGLSAYRQAPLQKPSQ